MAITTLAQVVSGLQPPMHFSKSNTNVGSSHAPSFGSSWIVAGWPVAGTPSASLAGAIVEPGMYGAGAMMPWNDPPGGANAYLARFQAQAVFAGGQGVAGFVLCDRLWHNGGISIGGTGAQTVNSVAFPARDMNGTSDGEGVLIGFEFSVNTNVVAPPTMTLSYTNQSGTAGRTGNAFTPSAVVSNAVASGFSLFSLQGGDTGVRSVQTLTINSAAWSAGSIHLVAFRPIAYLDAETPNRTYSIDASTGVVHRLYNQSALFVLVAGRGSSSQNMPLAGEIQVAWG